MSFTLRISFHGLCVVLPNYRTTDIVLIQPQTGGHHSAHTVNVLGYRGIQTGTLVPLPLKLTSDEIYLSDGDDRIIAATGPGPAHSISSRFPSLLPGLGMGWRTKQGVRPGEMPIAAECAARMQLYDGGFVGEVPTSEAWQLVKYGTGLPGSGPPVPGTEMDPMFTGFRYERTLDKTYCKLECLGATNKELRFEPENGVVHLIIVNHPHHDPDYVKDITNRSPHFDHVYEIFDQLPAERHALEEVKPHKAPPPGINLPCVGGCTC